MIRNGWVSTRFGIAGFLLSQITMVSVSDEPMTDAPSANYEKPSVWTPPPGVSGQFWQTWVSVPTGVTLANPGDQMRFTFALAFKYPFPDVDANFDKVIQKAGLKFGGTCTVTAT